MIRRFILKHMVNMFGRKKKHYGFFWDLYRYSLDGMNYGWGDYAIKNASERNIFKLLAERTGDDVLIFDGGAHEGEYTANFMDYFRNSSKKITVHAFEPMTASMDKYKELTKEFTGTKFVYNELGLAEKADKAPIFFNNDGSIIASIYKRQLDYFDIDFDKENTIELTTVDDYCRENKIEKLDLLKIVVEGSELRAIQGAEEMISAGKIGMIQFGFGGIAMDSRFYFRDFWNFFKDHGYTLYRVMIDGLLKIDHYDERYEVFQCVNFLAVNEK